MTDNPTAVTPAGSGAPVERGASTPGLGYAVDIAFCIDVTGSMTPIIDAVRMGALGFYDDVRANLNDKGKSVTQLRVRVIAFRDFFADGADALQESPFYTLPAERTRFSEFVNGLVARGGGDAPESGLEALAVAIDSPWTSTGDRRRHIIVVWTDQPAHPLNPSLVPADLGSRIPPDFDALTDAWEAEGGPLSSRSKRLILFGPAGAGWSDISAAWENVVHNPSPAGRGLSEVDYGIIVDSVGNSV